MLLSSFHRRFDFYSLNRHAYYNIIIIYLFVSRILERGEVEESARKSGVCFIRANNKGVSISKRKSFLTKRETLLSPRDLPGSCCTFDSRYRRSLISNYLVILVTRHSPWIRG